MITALLKTYWKPIAFLSVFIVSLWFVHSIGYSSGNADSNTTWQGKWDKRDEEDRKAEQAQLKKTTEQNKRLSAAQALAASNYLKGVQDGKASADKIIADYRNTNLRLQQRFDGLQCVSRSLSDTARTRSVSEAAITCGLSDRDVEFLVRFSQRADDTARQLVAAQQIIRNWKAITDGQKLPEK